MTMRRRELRRTWSVIGAAAVCAGTVALTGSDVVVVLVALAVVSLGVGYEVAGIVVSNFRDLWGAIAERQLRVGRNQSDELIDALTHDPFRAAREALDAAGARVGTSASFESALQGMESIESDLRATSASRGDARADTFRSLLLGGVASEMKETAHMTKRYGDPLTAPAWLPPRPRDVLVRVGLVLDDIRLLHNAQVEWSILLFTLWARAFLIGLAPLLPSLSFAPVPLSGGFGADDLPWLLASVWAAGCALIAPRIADFTMERTPRAARARKMMLAVELPLACAVTILNPSWMVVAFAAGWTNWWQRQWNDPLEPAEFNWPRLGAFVVVVVVTQAIGLAIDGVAAAEAIGEVLVTIAVIGIIGGSYGAMLPLSASVTAQMLAGAIVGRQRAARTARTRIEQSISDLLAAADVIEAAAAPDDPVARRDALVLRDVARQLRLREDLADRILRRTPLGLESLLDDALRTAGTMADTWKAGRLREEAASEQLPEPVTFQTASIAPKALRQAKLADRSRAKTLRRLVIRCAMEARVHGSGEVETLLRVEEEQLVLRVANAEAPRPAPSGRGRGRRELTSLARSLPGGDLTRRERVDSRFIDGTGAYELFGTEIRFDMSVLEDFDPKDARSTIIRS
jgi:hypothetical protein